MLDKIKKKIIGVLQKGTETLLPNKVGDLFEELIVNKTYKDTKEKYIQLLSKNTKFEKSFIRSLINKLEIIDNNIKCAHGPFELYLMQASLLALDLKGPVLELGCYKGGSTAKLSLICNLTGRELHAFDSFEGLPPPSELDVKHNFIPWISTKKTVHYTCGSYAGSLEEVKSNVSKYGNIDSCSFYKGFFEETLPNFSQKPAFIFMDVDYIESAKNVIKNLWPKLISGGYFFSHEALVEDYIKEISDPLWWRTEFNESPPLFYGAGYGICWRSGKYSFPSNLFYFKKN
ncbi:MAG: class I SAM-dependent methyltransferase [Candidatus Lokiarchaeota archaeon]|nr:class I SAM-dependent methyltransferase [Candidatus Lokiarchaeota archaeon]